MVVVCQQPSYLPWIGYFEQIARSNRFVFLDSVQWTKQGRQSRTRLPSPNNKERYWLSIPVQSKGHRERSLKDMRIAGSWAKRHWNIINNIYSKSPYFKSQLEPILCPFYEKVEKKSFLIDICIESLFLFWDQFSFSSEIHLSSELPECRNATERILSICENLNATTYYSGLGSTRYLNVDSFRNKNIGLEWQHIKAIYPEDISRPIDYSIIDWLANVEMNSIFKIVNQKSTDCLQQKNFGRWKNMGNALVE